MKDIKPLKSSLVEAVTAESSKTHCRKLMKMYGIACILEAPRDQEHLLKQQLNDLDLWEKQELREITMLALSMVADADQLPTANMDGVFKAINDLVE